MKHLNIFSKLIFFVVLLTSLFSCSPEKTYDTIEKPDFTSINETSKRKAAFIQYFLPIINEINNSILKDKKLLNHIAVSNNNNTLSEKQKQDLGKLENKYNLNEGTLDNSQKIKELTLIWKIGVKERIKLHKMGIFSWDNIGINSNTLKISLFRFLN